MTRALRGEFDYAQDAFVYIVNFRLPCTNVLLCKIGSGTGSRINTVQNEIRRVRGFDIQIKHYPFATAGEAIVFEHLVHKQVFEYQYIVPVEFKFPGHTEVFTKSPNLQAVENHPALALFR